MPNFELFIPINVPSSKNSKTWTGKHLVWSKSAQKYVKDTKEYWEEFALTFRNEYDKYESLANLPMPATFQFIRGTRHKFDYVNPLQTVLDLMVKYEWIPDDNAEIILPIFEIYKYDKEKPGVYIKFKGY
jgi:Holliday junction resolvase RusA-like endonuclease